MGWTAHDTVIATVSDYSASQVGLTGRVEAWRAALPEKWATLVHGPVMSVVNGYLTWVMLPDGSKSGWTDDEIGDLYRAEFAALFNGAYADIVEVKFGADLRGENVDVKAEYIDVESTTDDDPAPVLMRSVRLVYPTPGFPRPSGECRLRVIRLPDSRVVAVVTEIPDNPGASVTNAAEHIAIIRDGRPVWRPVRGSDRDLLLTVLDGQI
jgi:hypothetical protein